MCRVVVVGANGAGKTWLAQRLGYILGAPVIHKDALALTAHWHQRSREDVHAALVDKVSDEGWILEGGPSILVQPILDRTTFVIWLDIPAPLRAWRVFCRSARYLGRTRPEHPVNNRDWPGPRQARFLWRSLTAGPRFRSAVADALKTDPTPVIRLRTPHDVKAFLDQIASP